MTDHDPLCPWFEEGAAPDDTVRHCPWCPKIAQVRADERERIARELDEHVAAYPEDVWPPLGVDPPAVGTYSMDRIGAHAMRHAYRNAARIARGES